MRIPAIKGFDEQAFNKYLKNTGWLMFGKIMNLLVNLIIARHLGPGLFGDLNFADALTAIIAAVGTLGLDSFIIRELINEPQKRNEILGTSLWMRLGVNLLLIPLSAAVYLIFHHFSRNPGNSLTWIIVVYALTSFFKSFNVIDSYFQSQVQSKYVVHVQNVSLVLTSIFKILLVWFQASLIWFAFSFTLDGIILATGLVTIYHRKGFHLRDFTFSSSRARQLLRQSLPLILSAVMVSIYMKIDQVMLKSLGSEAVGIYSAAARISEAWYFIPVAIVTSVFPALINARKTDLERYLKRLGNLYDLLVYMSLPVAVAITFFGAQITHLVYGEQFNGAGPMLSIHIWSGVFVFLGSASGQYLLAEGYTGISFQRTAFGALTNILFNLWLIPAYGGIGASVATLIACSSSALYLLFIPKTRKQGLMMLKSLFLLSLMQKLIRKKTAA